MSAPPTSGVAVTTCGQPLSLLGFHPFILAKSTG